ncbi:hypothetical protein CPB86DRAFT_786241, partial [Serendipita vermifera]
MREARPSSRSITRRSRRLRLRRRRRLPLCKEYVRSFPGLSSPTVTVFCSAVDGADVLPTRRLSTRGSTPCAQVQT